MNSTVGPIFNEKVIKKYNLWVHEQCTVCTVHGKKSNIAAEKLLNSNKIGQNAWEKKSRLKRLKTQNVRLGNANALPKRTLKPYMDGDFN